MDSSPIPRDDSARRAAARDRATSRSTWASVALNVALCVGQIGMGLAASSSALIADGVHSLSDLLSDAVVLIASREARKAPDAEHPYGHHRFETGASLALGAILLAVGLGILASAASKLAHPGAMPNATLAAASVALAALISKEILFRYMLAAAERVKSAMLVANAWHARSDAASSLVALAGLAGSALGYPLLDPAAAILVGAMVAKTGWSFGWEALHDLMDRAADAEEMEQIKLTLLSTPGVLGAHDIKARKMGDMLLIDAHLEVDARLSVAEGHDIAVEARARVLGRHRALNLMTHVDPFMRRDADHDEPEPR